MFPRQTSGTAPRYGLPRVCGGVSQELVHTDFKAHWDKNEITRRYAEQIREQKRTTVLAEVAAIDEYLYSVSLPAKVGDFMGKAAADFMVAFRKHV